MMCRNTGLLGFNVFIITYICDAIAVSLLPAGFELSSDQSLSDEPSLSQALGNEIRV